MIPRVQYSADIGALIITDRAIDDGLVCAGSNPPCRFNNHSAVSFGPESIEYRLFFRWRPRQALELLIDYGS